MTRTLVLALLLVGLSGCDESEVAGVLVTATTSDGATLRASYQRPDSEDVRQTLLLLHQVGGDHDRSDFDFLWDALVDVGYGLLAPDLRSHGSSDDLGASDVLLDDPNAYPRDVDIWLRYLQEREDDGESVSPARTGIVGLGSSASLAAAAVAAGRGRCAIAYSPEIREVNFFFGAWEAGPEADPGPELRDDLTLNTTFWLAADGDQPSSDDVVDLHAATEGETGLHVEEGIHYGQELLVANDDTLGVTVDWCADKL